MARRDEDRASSDGEFVSAVAVAEGHGNSAAGLCVQAKPSCVDTRSCDHAAGHIRHDACQRLPT